MSDNIYEFDAEIFNENWSFNAKSYSYYARGSENSNGGIYQFSEEKHDEEGNR